MARARNARRKAQIRVVEELDGPTPEQMAKGNVSRIDMIHADTAQRVTVHKVRDHVQEWHVSGVPGFEEPAMYAIEWCQRHWEARGVLGKQSASYEPTIPGGQNHARDIEMHDELDEMKAMFPAKWWNVFEDVCRWGRPAGVAGSEWADNNPQAIATARAIVGTIANTIAMKLGC